MEIKLYSTTANRDPVRKMIAKKQRGINISPVALDAEPKIIRIPLKKVCEIGRPEFVAMSVRLETFPNYGTRWITG